MAGKVFTYSGALAAADVLSIDAEACTVTKNGVAAMAGTSTTCQYPELVKGSNPITAKTAGFTLGLAYRRRYE